jgi:hypothetical protein
VLLRGGPRAMNTNDAIVLIFLGDLAFMAFMVWMGLWK